MIHFHKFGVYPGSEGSRSPRGGVTTLFGRVYPDPFGIRDHFFGLPSLLLVEGEFDCMLAWQHAHHKVDIATLGGALTRSHTGWIITSGGSQLILPAGSSQQVGNNSPLILKKRGKSPHSSAAANRVIDILPIAEVEEERKRGENLPILAVLAEYGIAPTPYVLELIRLPHITPNYIRFHDRRLQKENRYPPACSSLSILPPTSPLLDFGSLPSSSPSSTFTQLVLNKQDIKSPTKLSRKIKMVLRSSSAFSFSSPVSRGPSG